MFYQFQHFGLSESFSREFGKNFHFPMHLHQSFEYITALAGEVTVTVDQETYRLKVGDAVLVFPNQLHSIECEDGEHMLCIFSPELIRAYTSKTATKIPVNNFFSPDPSLQNALLLLSENAPSFEKKGILYSLCTAFDRSATYQTRIRNDHLLLYKIFEFVENNYKNSCSLANLSKEMGYDYSYLSRYFKKITQLSFNEYVNRYRINNACRVLTNTTDSMIQCAFESGYRSLRSFNRNFKTIMGITPQEYRGK